MRLLHTSDWHLGHTLYDHKRYEEFTCFLQWLLKTLQQERVDSLFLDEGFGMLDEEALETALGALSSLNQQGKLIGIISHVLALKERISTQITVQRADAGRSTPSGPGVEKVSGA